MNHKKDFPVYKNLPSLIYLDSAASSLKPACVIDKLNEYYQTSGVNIRRGLYDLSTEGEEEFEVARRKIAEFINAAPEEIIFTKNATDALNTVCRGLKDKLKKDDEVITTVLEHHSSLLPWLDKAKKGLFKIKYIELEEGRITVNGFLKEITPNTKILVVTMASNLLGYVTPVEEICREARKHNIKVIIDAAQAAPHLKIDVKAIDCDFLAISLHKMYGPFGVGILYGKEKELSRLNISSFGGEMVSEVAKDEISYAPLPFCMEAGTQAVAEVIASGKAVDYINKIGFAEIRRHEASLTAILTEELKKLPYITVYNPHPDIGIVAFNFKGIHAHDAATFLNEEGICVRAGKHCAELALAYLNVTSTLRVSFGIYNTKEDVDKLINALKKCFAYFNEKGQTI